MVCGNFFTKNNTLGAINVLLSLKGPCFQIFFTLFHISQCDLIFPDLLERTFNPRDVLRLDLMRSLR